MVYRERRAERTKTCVLCSGGGIIKLSAVGAEGTCWHCHGEGETKYVTMEGGWIQCYCKQQPRRRPSQGPNLRSF